MTEFEQETLQELKAIRKTLEDIEFILEYAHVPQYSVKRYRNESGKIIRNFEYHEDPLGHLRTGLHKLRQSSQNHNPQNEDQS